MKLKMAKFMSVVTIALLLAGCGAKSEETPIPDDSEVQSEEAVSEKAESASSGDASVSEAEPSVDESLISENEAKSIALKDAGITEDQTSGIRVKLERDDGVQQYEVEFYAGDKEYDYEIDAVTGNILNKDMDIEDDFQKSGTSDASISEGEARKIALNEVSGAGENDIRIHQDKDDGRTIYEGTIIYKERKYEFEIDANSGKILEWEEESLK